MEIGPRLEALKLFARRLAGRSAINHAEREALLGLSGFPQQVGAHRDFVRLGEELQHCCLIVDGLVARYAQLEDGCRQIINLHVPGDMVDLYSLLLPRAPSPLQALTPTTVLKVPHEALRQLAFKHEGLSAAIWRDCVVDGAIVAQWLVNVGQKDTRGRIAHLLCEMAVRYAHIGRLDQGRFQFAMTQEQIGEVTGLTSVHVNRSIKSLRQDGLVRWNRAEVEILDWVGLADLAGFDPGCVHLPFAPEDFGLAAARQVV